MANLDVNDHLVLVGDFGIYQWVSLLVNGFLVCFFGMQMFVTVFTHATPPFRCANADGMYNSSLFVYNNTFNSQCTYNSNTSDVTISCNGYEYDTSDFTATVVTEFDVVCDSAQYITMVNMAWMLSEGIGSVLGSYICDRFGRKPMIIATYIVMGVFGTASTFSVNLVMYTILRCSMALVCFAGFAASIALLSESTSPNKRAHALNALDLFWAIGAASLALWAYLMRNWKHLQLFISVTAIPIGIICIWVLDESPHWLLINGKKQKAIDVLNKMARWNKVVAPQLEMEQCGLLDEKKQDESDNEMKRSTESCCDIWKHRRVVVRFFVFSAGWVSCAFCYYALSFGVGELKGSLYLNSFIMSAVEIFAYICCFCIAWWGRKWPTVSTYLGGGISLLIAIILMKFAPGSEAITVLSFIGKFCISAAWQIILVWQTEVYPTTHRCTLSVLNGVVGRIGLVAAPYMVDMHKYIDVANVEYILPSIYVVLMVTVGLLHVIPPETNNRKLPETLVEANAITFPMAKDEKDFDQVEDNVLLDDVAKAT